MNGFDHGILMWASQCAARSPAATDLAWSLSGADLIKGQAFMAAVWWLWFGRKSGRETREVLAATMVSAFAAIFIGRALAHLLPFRLRPMFNPELGFIPPARELAEHGMRFWSAFPSDHAMLFSALATGFWRISRRLGAAAHLYWIAAIGLPRVFVGLHHPTDLLGGAVIGAAVAWTACLPRVRAAAAGPLVDWAEARPGPFYALFFLVAVQIGTMFAEPRALAVAAVRLLRP